MADMQRFLLFSAMKMNLSEANALFCHGGIRFRNMMMLNSTSTTDCRSSPSQNCWTRYLAEPDTLCWQISQRGHFAITKFVKPWSVLSDGCVNTTDGDVIVALFNLGHSTSQWEMTKVFAVNPALADLLIGDQISMEKKATWLTSTI